MVTASRRVFVTVSPALNVRWAVSRPNIKEKLAELLTCVEVNTWQAWKMRMEKTLFGNTAIRNTKASM